jgi:broad specificity phosphatase PhoE
MPLLALLRHAEEAGTGAAGAPVYVRGPRGISQLGRRQAEAAAGFLDPLEVERVIASDARRAIETAEIVGGGGEVEQWPELRGLQLGDWDGVPVDELTELPGVLSDPTRRPPGGESLEDLLGRARPALERALAADGDTIVVSHRMTNAVLLADVMGLSLAAAGLILQDPAGINVLERRGRRPVVAMLNVSALDPLHTETAVASLA